MQVKIFLPVQTAINSALKNALLKKDTVLDQIDVFYYIVSTKEHWMKSKPCRLKEFEETWLTCTAKKGASLVPDQTNTKTKCCNI